MSSERSDIDRLRRTSKRLLRDVRAGKPEALRLMPRHDREPKLADAQYAVAKTLGFQSWPQMVATVGTGRFEPWNDPHTRLVLVRAGARETHRRNVIQQHVGPGLSEVGREQATTVGRRLASGEFGTISAVFTSRRPSTIETANIIAAVLDIELEEPTCDFCDIHPGDAEGLTQDEMFDRYGPNYDFVPNAETHAHGHERLVAALRRVAERHRGKTVVIATESAGIAASLAAFGGFPRGAAWEVPHGSVTVWNTSANDRDPRRAGKWNLQRFNDTSRASP
jgi:probable phosphoglycerate mutase